MNQHLIRSTMPARFWHEGHPFGNGRTGGVFLGDGYTDRIALNIESLWRNSLSYQERHTGGDFKKIRDICLRGDLSAAHKKALETIPYTSETVYANPYVPLGDLYLYSDNDNYILHDYSRTLDLSTAVAASQYTIKGATFKTEAVSLYRSDVILVRLSSDKPAALCGGMALSRISDPECALKCVSDKDTCIMEGEFEEGVRFAVCCKIIHRGGRLTGYGNEFSEERNTLNCSTGTNYRFSKRNDFKTDRGAHCRFDSIDEILLVITAASDDGSTNNSPSDVAMKKLSSFCDGRDLFGDCDSLLSENAEIHRKYYNSVSLDLGEHTNLPDNLLLYDAHTNNSTSAAISEKLFNMGRYLAICSGYPQNGAAPINLQGIWNQDTKPAWESDLHLDLNVEMCYWSLASVGLSNFYLPLINWAIGLKPQARTVAKDLYGCNGICFGVANDLCHIGNYDDLGYPYTGAATWLAQTMYQYYEYTGDKKVLREQLYPFMKEIAVFYEDFLYETADRQLIPVPSASMEAGVKGQEPWGIFSSPSSMELTLIHWLLKTVSDTAKQLGIDIEKAEVWADMERRVPQIYADSDGVLKEWLGDEEMDDPGHRHRSSLIGLCPGDSINFTDTPDLMPAARKLLETRRKFAHIPKIAWEKAWDMQLFARLHDGKSVQNALNELVQNFMLPNFMLNTTNTRTDNHPWFNGEPLLQLDASLGLISAITDCIIQDRDRIYLLPALPENWENGSLEGFCLKGGVTADVFWKKGKLTSAKFTVSRPRELRISLADGFSVLQNGSLFITSHNGIVTISAQKGVYEVINEKE